MTPAEDPPEAVLELVVVLDTLHLLDTLLRRRIEPHHRPQRRQPEEAHLQEAQAEDLVTTILTVDLMLQEDTDTATTESEAPLSLSTMDLDNTTMITNIAPILSTHNMLLQSL